MLALNLNCFSSRFVHPSTKLGLMPKSPSTTVINIHRIARLKFNTSRILRDELADNNNANVPINNEPVIKGNPAVEAVNQEPIVNVNDTIVNHAPGSLEAKYAALEAQLIAYQERPNANNHIEMTPEEIHRQESIRNMEIKHSKQTADMLAMQSLEKADLQNPEKGLLHDLPEKLDWVCDTADLIEQHENMYKRAAINKGKIYYPNSNKDHFKNRSRSSFIAGTNSMFEKWTNHKDMYKQYLTATVKATRHNDPVDRKYLQSLTGSLLGKASNHKTPLFTCNPSGVNSSAKSIYGMAHGAYDLVHFMPSRYKTLDIHVKYENTKDADENSPLLKVFIKTTDMGDNLNEFQADSLYRVFNVEHPVDRAPDAECSCINPNARNAVLSELYNIDSLIECPDNRITVKFANQSVLEKVAYSVRDDKIYQTVQDAIKHVSVNTQKLDIPCYADGLMYQMFPLFMLGEINGVSAVDREEILSYIGSCVYQYVKNRIRTSDSSFITNIDFKMCLKRKLSNDELKPKFNSLVDNGCITPLTPLHYHFYFGYIHDMSVWEEFIFRSAVLNSTLTPDIRSFMPRMDSDTRYQFSQIARDHKYLDTDYYHCNDAPEWELKLGFGINWNTFLKEMYVRTIINESMPDYLYAFSAGLWELGPQSIKAISPATTNRHFCKFMLGDGASSAPEFIESMLFDNHGIRHLRTNTRLTQYLPNIYSSYVPTSSMTKTVSSVCKHDLVDVSDVE